jgi:hypothetical protein
VQEGKETVLDLRLPAPGALTGVVRDAAGQPLAGITVCAGPVSPGGGWSETVQAVTDAAGRFLLDGLAAGWYNVAVTLHLGLGASASEVAVAAGATADVGELRVVPPERGQVWGRVVLPDGQTPAARARVVLSYPDSGSITSLQITGADGRFILENVPPGRYRLTAWKVGYAPSSAVDVDVWTQEAPVQTLPLRVGGTISGRVWSVNPAQRVRGLTVAAVPAEEKWARYSPNWTVRTALTGPDGRYTLHDAPPGRVRLLVLRDGQPCALRRSVDVASGQTTPHVNVPLWLSDGVVTGRVTDAASQPLPWAQVRASHLLLPSRPAVVTVDERGQYHLVGRPHGDYHLTATAPGHAAQTVTVTVTGKAAATADFGLIEERKE